MTPIHENKVVRLNITPKQYITIIRLEKALHLLLNAELNIESQERAVKDCFIEALKKTQRLMAKKMQEMGGIPGLS
jgi:AraC-like DNA-binding protein